MNLVNLNILREQIKLNVTLDLYLIWHIRASGIMFSKQIIEFIESCFMVEKII